MAKKKTAQEQQQFTDDDGKSWGDDVPEPVQEAVDSYVKAMRAKNAAKKKEDAAKIACIESMKEHKVPRVRIDEGKKWLVCDQEDKLKTESIPKAERSQREAA